MAKRKRPTFDEWYTEIYGERWPALRRALAADPRFYELREGLLRSYFLDEASVLAARALEVQPGNRVLDMCAAPGGKTLVLALALDGRGGITANDRSSARRARLHRVLDDHLPPRLRETIVVAAHDAARWGVYEQDVYDRILLDAPCSSERHIATSPAHEAKWSPSRTKSLSSQAYAMLSSAYLAAKPGGVIVYCTCALSPLENDDVVAKLVKKRPADILSVESEIGTRTEYGIQISPDTDDRRGPMYICRLRKSS